MQIQLCKGTLQGNMKLFHAMKVNTCTVCEIGLFPEEEDDGEIGVLTILRMTLQRCIFSESLIVYRTTCRPRYVSKMAYNCSVLEL